jgi:hypothetical protein
MKDQNEKSTKVPLPRNQICLSRNERMKMIMEEGGKERSNPYAAWSPHGGKEQDGTIK